MGEQADPETGQVHLRARPYAPGLGRLLSTDSMFPNMVGTQGYQPYAYAGNNPTTWSDPSGNNPACFALGFAGPIGPLIGARCFVIVASLIVYGAYTVDQAGEIAGCATLSEEDMRALEDVFEKRNKREYPIPPEVD